MRKGNEKARAKFPLPEDQHYGPLRRTLDRGLFFQGESSFVRPMTPYGLHFGLVFFTPLLIFSSGWLVVQLERLGEVKERQRLSVQNTENLD